MKKARLDKEEADLLASIESGEWESVPNVEEEIKRHGAYAQNTLKKDRRVNIRLSSGDLSDIQVKALEQGVPYQTLIASVLHRYVTGHLAERSEAAVRRPRSGASRRRGTSAN